MRAIPTTLAAVCLCFSAIAAADEAVVRSRDLPALRVPGKVAAVLWTVRQERCTLQVVYPNAARIPAAKSGPLRRLQPPEVQVWLLRANGTVIPPTQRADPGNGPGEQNPRTPYGEEVLFAFPRSAETEAVAAAIRVDGAFYIEPIRGISGETG